MAEPQDTARLIEEARGVVERHIEFILPGVTSSNDHIDLIRRLADALSRRVEGWRPIETAPRDGAMFDAWEPDAFGGRRMVGLSFNKRGELRQHGTPTKAEFPRWPTHWRPLPDPPLTPPASNMVE